MKIDLLLLLYKEYWLKSNANLLRHLYFCFYSVPDRYLCLILCDFWLLIFGSISVKVKWFAHELWRKHNRSTCVCYFSPSDSHIQFSLCSLYFVRGTFIIVNMPRMLGRVINWKKEIHSISVSSYSCYINFFLIYAGGCINNLKAIKNK